MAHSLGLPGSIYLGNGALQVAQLQIQTAGRNVANASTDGATRQRVVSTEDITLNIGGGDMSIGVVSLGLTSLRSSYLDTQVQNENSNQGYAEQMDAFTGQVQDALSEQLSSTQLDPTQATSQNGLIAAATNLYTAWSSLSSSPTSDNYRDAVSSATNAFVTTAKTVYNQIASVKEGVFNEANTEVATANQLAGEIASYNVQIAKAEIGASTAQGVPINQANDLRDARQTAIESLSKLVNITVTPNASRSDMVDIALADSPSVSLVTGMYGAGASTTSALSVTGSNPATGATGYAIGNALSFTATSATNGTATVAPTGGSLGGLLNVDNNVIGREQTSAAAFSAGGTLLDRYNTFVNNVVTGINSAQASGFDVNGNPVATPIFTTSATSTTASTGTFDLNVNQSFDLNNAAYNNDLFAAAATTNGQLDGDNATAIANLQNSAGTLSLYKSVVTTVGADRSAAATNLSSQNLVSTQVENQRNSVSGISVNDETVDLLTFQRAFEASSKFINTLDQMYQTIINNLS
ncbi:MAG TPA: flagellar hook-associated protein FlgK [Candidatus Methylacidiphilales bacterium]